MNLAAAQHQDEQNMVEDITEPPQAQDNQPHQSEDGTTYIGSDLTMKEVHTFYIPWLEKTVMNNKLFELLV